MRKQHDMVDSIKVTGAVVQSRGFTLIELMIVVAIVAILAALAYPSYTRYMQKGRRSDAMSSLLKIQLEQEKWRVNNTSYGTLANVWTGTDSLDGYYTLAVPANNAAGFTATATPKAGGLQVGDSCGTFAINQDNPDYSGTYANATCWGK